MQDVPARQNLLRPVEQSESLLGGSVLVVSAAVCRQFAFDLGSEQKSIEGVFPEA